MPVMEGARQSSRLTVNVREGMWGALGRPARSQGERCQTLPACPHCALGPWVSLLLVVPVLQGTHLPREATTPTTRPLLQAKLQPRVSLTLGTPSSGQKPHHPLPRYVSASEQHTIFLELAKAES